MVYLDKIKNSAELQAEFSPFIPDWHTAALNFPKNHC